MADIKKDFQLIIATGDRMEDQLIEDVIDNLIARSDITRSKIAEGFANLIDNAKASGRLRRGTNAEFNELAESQGMTAEQFKSKIHAAIASHFPKRTIN